MIVNVNTARTRTAISVWDNYAPKSAANLSWTKASSRVDAVQPWPKFIPCWIKPIQMWIDFIETQISIQLAGFATRHTFTALAQEHRNWVNRYLIPSFFPVSSRAPLLMTFEILRFYSESSFVASLLEYNRERWTSIFSPNYKDDAQAFMFPRYPRKYCMIFPMRVQSMLEFWKQNI